PTSLSLLDALPIFHGDPLGTFTARHPVRRAPPLKLRRRSIRYLRDQLDGLRPLEQPQWPQWRLALDPIRPCGLHSCGQMMLRRRRQYRALRNMGLLRQMHDDALSADARGDAVDQGCQFVIVMDG